MADRKESKKNLSNWGEKKTKQTASFDVPTTGPARTFSHMGLLLLNEQCTLLWTMLACKKKGHSKRLFCMKSRNVKMMYYVAIDLWQPRCFEFTGTRIWWHASALNKCVQLFHPVNEITCRSIIQRFSNLPTLNYVHKYKWHFLWADGITLQPAGITSSKKKTIEPRSS